MSRIHKIPLRFLGYKNIPAIPYQLKEIPETLIKLDLRANATTQAKWGMSNFYQIDGFNETGYSYQFGRGEEAEKEAEEARQKLISDLESPLFPLEVFGMDLSNLLPSGLFGFNFKDRLANNEHPLTTEGADPATLLSLSSPEQFAMSWTTFNGVYDNAQTFLPEMVGGPN